jgi:hypothetical protein
MFSRQFPIHLWGISHSAVPTPQSPPTFVSHHPSSGQTTSTTSIAMLSLQIKINDAFTQLFITFYFIVCQYTMDLNPESSTQHSYTIKEKWEYMHAGLVPD